MSLFNDEVKKQLGDILTGMESDVSIMLFLEEGCNTCAETEAFMDEFQALSDRLSLVKLEESKDEAEFERFGIDRTPAYLLLDAEGEDHGVRFYGIPAGYEINSFVSAVLDFGGAEDEEIPAALAERIEAIDQPTNIKVFVTLSCPHCPGAVQKAHKLARMNPNITAEMIEAQTFANLSNEFKVSSVPQIVFNDDNKYSLLGNQPLDVFVDELEKAQA